MIHLDPHTLVVVDCPPSPARGHRHGPCPPTGPRDRPWTPDELTYPPLGREPVDRSVTSREKLPMKEVIMFSPGRGVATPSADSAGDVAIGVATLAGVITTGVASSADLAGDATVSVVAPAVAEVASSTDLAEVASSADAKVASSADLAGVASSADLAGVVSSADLAGPG